MARHLLTDKQLQAAKAKDRDYVLNDGDGLYARVHKATLGKPRRITFYYRFKLNGRDRWYNLGCYPKPVSLKEAREERDAKAKLVAKGIDPGVQERREREERAAQEAARAREKTVRALFSDWQAFYLAREWKDGGALVKHFLSDDVLPYIGDMKAKDVRKADIVEIIDRIVSRGAARKANAVLSMLKQMFAWAFARGVLEVDPTHGLKRSHAGGTERPRERNLSSQEISELAARLPTAKLPKRAEAALWLLLATGARVGELVGAKWSEFDLAGATWAIPADRSKNGKAHIVHLSAFALAWLAKLRELSPGELLFEGRKEGEPLDSKQIGKYVRDRQRSQPHRGRSKKTAVLVLSGGDWRVHDLRRTMASRMGDLGIAPHVIEKCLNHSLEGILRVYQHQEYLPERQSAFERWGAELSRLASGEAAQSNVVVMRRMVTG